jgi:hypothetical protein
MSVENLETILLNTTILRAYYVLIISNKLKLFPLQVGGGRLYRVPPIRALFHTLTGARYIMLFHQVPVLYNQLQL